MNTSPTDLLFSHLFDKHRIHCFWLDGQPAFLAHEVGAALGIQNTSNNIRRSKVLQEGIDYDICSPKELALRGVEGVGTILNVDSKLPNRLIVLLESGLYTFVLRSDKPAAIDFHQWVVDEVLPAIRKQGFYAQVPSALQDDKNPKHLLDLINMAGKGNRWAEGILTAKGLQPAPPKPQVN